MCLKNFENMPKIFCQYAQSILKFWEIYKIWKCAPQFLKWGQKVIKIFQKILTIIPKYLENKLKNFENFGNLAKMYMCPKILKIRQKILTMCPK
jgi:hypothetical protein